jgi:hypothetical protein
MEKQYAVKDGYWLMGFQYEVTGSLYSFGQIPRCKVSMLEHLKTRQQTAGCRRRSRHRSD